MIELTLDQVQAIEAQKPTPLHVVNPATQEVFVLIRKEGVSNSGDVSEEPPEETMGLRWSKTRRKIRAAAKVYSEQTHADY